MIPPKQYGSGAVLLWDADVTPRGDPERTTGKGGSSSGSPARSAWRLVLVRCHGSRYGKDGKAWLLIKEDDEYAQPAHEAGVVEEHPNSVRAAAASRRLRRTTTACGIRTNRSRRT